MIGFFRRIRKKLADDNKPLKYMRYAIGEIVLVMVGILLALQVNNWNEERKILKEEQILLKDLKVEIITNIKNLEGSIRTNQISLDNAEKLNMFYQTPEKLVEFSGDSLIRMTWKLPGNIFIQENGILNSILSFGQINTIKNKKLKYLLAPLIDKAEKKTNYSKQVNKVGSEYLDKIIYPKLQPVIKDGKTIKGDYKDMFKIPEFHLAIRGIFIGRRTGSIENEKELKIIYEEVLTLINGEIESQ